MAGLFFAFLTAIVYRYLLGRHEGVAWLAGGFMFMGYMVHLVLDEIYSVDVLGTRIKRSFGTALKFYDGRRLDHSVAMAVATVALLFVTPPTKTFVDGMSSRDMWSGLRQRMLPHDHKWFGVFGDITAMAWRKPQPPAQTTEPRHRSRELDHTARSRRATAPAAKPHHDLRLRRDRPRLYPPGTPAPASI